MNDSLGSLAAAFVFVLVSVVMVAFVLGMVSGIQGFVPSPPPVLLDSAAAPALAPAAP